MKIQIKDKPRDKYINPPFVGGNVYQNLDNKCYYLAAIIPGDAGILINMSTGQIYSQSFPYGHKGSRFIDVTENVHFIAEI